jgi:hypothetical protein
MAIERKWPSIPPRLLTADGGTQGQVQLADTRGIKVKQRVVLSAVALPDLAVEVKRVLSDTLLIVGAIGKPIHDRSVNLSAYTTAAGAFIYAEEQDKAALTLEDRLYATYDQEPTVAWRTVLVDQLGRYYETANPLPVRLSDGSINIGTVNAELEVQLSHLDDTPNLGDVHDSVRVGGPSGEEMEVNADGSINVNIVNSTGVTVNRVIENIVVPNANQEYSFTFPDGTKKFYMRVRDGMAQMQITYTGGESDTKFITVNMGCNYTDIEDASNKTIYFQLDKPNKIIELLYWVES